MPPRENPDYPRVLQTQQFIFLIGKDQTPMTIHTGLLEGLSAPLNAMINNGYMKESLEGVAVPEDVEPAIFAAFCEFAYTGTYTTPECAAPSVINPSGNKNTMNTPQPLRKRKRDVDGKDFEKLQTEFDHLVGRNNKENFSDLFLDPLHSSPNRPDLLFGAKIYVFATRFLIAPLRRLALVTLYYHLYKSVQTDDTRKAIIDMIRYTYDNTGSTEPGGKPYLRMVTIVHVARNTKFLNKNNELLDCCNKNVELQSDLLEAILRKQ